MCKNFPEINTYLCHHQTEAGFESLDPAGARQSYAPYQLPLGHGSSWFSKLISGAYQRWADCEIFQSESNPDQQKFNPIQSWSGKFLKIIGPIQSWSAHVKPCMLFCLLRQNRHSFLAFPKFNMAMFILQSEAKALLELFAIRWTRLVELIKWQGW